jgi:hypothetical protein
MEQSRELSSLRFSGDIVFEAESEVGANFFL